MPLHIIPDARRASDEEVGERLVMVSGRGAAGDVSVCCALLFLEEEEEEEEEGMVVSGQR